MAKKKKVPKKKTREQITEQLINRVFTEMSKGLGAEEAITEALKSLGVRYTELLATTLSDVYKMAIRDVSKNMGVKLEFLPLDKDMIRDILYSPAFDMVMHNYSLFATQEVRDTLSKAVTVQPEDIFDIKTELMNKIQVVEQRGYNIARTEMANIYNTSLEKQYEKIDPTGEQFKYHWFGPQDKRTTDICERLKKISGNGVTLSELREMVREEATSGQYAIPGFMYDRARPWLPHFQCRHTFIAESAGLAGLTKELQKGRVYLEPGQEAPEGKKVIEGPKGGRYYEVEGEVVGEGDWGGWTHRDWKESNEQKLRDFYSANAKYLSEESLELWYPMTGMPHYDDMMANPEFYRDNEGYVFNIVEMTPAEYLTKCAEGFKAPYWQVMMHVEEANLDYILNAWRNEGRLPMLMLDYSRGRFTQEGRHRAVLAMRLGMRSVPVIMVYDTGDKRANVVKERTRELQKFGGNRTYRTYLKPGEMPPEGYEVKIGPLGGRYYEATRRQPAGTHGYFGSMDWYEDALRNGGQVKISDYGGRWWNIQGFEENGRIVVVEQKGVVEKFSTFRVYEYRETPHPDVKLPTKQKPKKPMRVKDFEWLDFEKMTHEELPEGYMENLKKEAIAELNEWWLARPKAGRSWAMNAVEGEAEWEMYALIDKIRDKYSGIRTQENEWKQLLSEGDMLEIIVRGTLGSVEAWEFRSMSINTKPKLKLYFETKRGSKGVNDLMMVDSLLGRAHLHKLEVDLRKERIDVDPFDMDMESLKAITKLAVDGHEDIDGDTFKAHRFFNKAFSKLPPKVQQATLEVMSSIGEDFENIGIGQIGIVTTTMPALGQSYSGTGMISIDEKMFREGDYHQCSNEELQAKLEDFVLEVFRFGASTTIITSEGSFKAKDRPDEFMRTYGVLEELEKNDLRLQFQGVIAHELGHQIVEYFIKNNFNILEEFRMLGEKTNITAYAMHNKLTNVNGVYVPHEPFAECYEFYKTCPGYLKFASPSVYEWFKEHGFKEGYNVNS